MATRATIRSRARVKADQDSTNGTTAFPTDAQYNDIIDEQGREVWYDLIRAGWPLDFSSVDLAATGSTTLPLGVGTVAYVFGVFRKDGGIFTELKRLNEGNRASLMSTAGNQAEYYSARISPSAGAVVELLPTPSAGTYRVLYVTEWPGFASDSDTWYGPARSDQLLVIRSAIEGARKESDMELVAELAAEYDRVLTKVMEMANAFDMRNGPSIRAVNDPIGDRVRDPFAYNAVGDY